MDGAVDEGGWQYASSGVGSTWMATAQRQHQRKRRKWIRMSKKKANRGGNREVRNRHHSDLFFAYGDCLLRIQITMLHTYV